MARFKPQHEFAMRSVQILSVCIFLVLTSLRGIAAEEVKLPWLDPVSNKWGFVSPPSAIFVIPARFDYASRYSPSGVAVVSEGGKFGCIDISGSSILPPGFDEINTECNGFMRFRVNDLYGFLDSRGKIVIPPQFHEAEDFHGGMARVRDEAGAISFVDVSGKIAFSTDGHSATDCSDDLIGIRGDQGWHYVDLKGEIVIRGPFSDANGFSEGLAVVRVGKSYGYINRTGDLAIPANYAVAGDFRGDRAYVKVGDGYCYIDRAGAIKIPGPFLGVTDFSNSGVAMVTVPGHEGKAAFIDRSGKSLSDEKFDQAEIMIDGFALVSSAGGYGYLTANGKWALKRDAFAPPQKQDEQKVELQDRAQAVEVITTEANRGNADSQYTLGEFFEKGRMVPRSVPDALKWYRLAAENGNALAQIRLGVIYETGAGVDVDLTASSKWFEMALADPIYGDIAKKNVSRVQEGLRRR